MADLPADQLRSLLNRIAQRDEQAFTTLYRHYRRSVHAYLRHRVIDADAVEEILQDTFLAIHRKPQAYDGRSKFSTWLCGIADNKIGDWARKRRRQVKTEDADDERVEAVADPEWDVLVRLTKAAEANVVRNCIDALPEAQRMALFWAFFEGESMREVAERLECLVGTVKSRIHYAIRRVGDCVKHVLGATR